MKLRNLFKKSHNDVLDHASYVGIDGGFSYIGSMEGVSDGQNVRYNTNFVYACVKKVEQYLASVPLHLYYWSSNPTKMLTNNRTVSKSFKRMVQNENRIIKKSGKEMVEIEESPELTLLQNPSPDMSYSDWIGIIASYLLLTGNALLEVVKKGEQVIALKPLKWEHTTVNISGGKIVSYAVSDPNDNSKVFSPDQVIHIRNYQAGNLLLGRGNLTAGLDSAKLYTYYDQYQLTLAANYAMPAVTINVKNRIANEDEAKAVADRFMLRFGKCNNGKPLVTFGDVELKPLSIAPKDMEYAEGRSAARKVICSVMGVPEDLITTEDSNRASSITAINSFKQITIYPLLSKILDQINAQVTNRYFDEDSFLWFDPTETMDNDPVQQSVLLKNYIDSGIMTVDEARAIIGLESIPANAEPAVEG